jgi:N-acyl-D-aspartate/D-glutamate deacylase
MTLDCVIRGGTVVDGSGAAPFRADVGIRDGEVAVVDRDLDAPTVIDAGDAFVLPGFIDLHTHYDAQVHWDPWLTPSCFHGVTTVVAGNCGLSLAPCRSEARETMVGTLESVEDMRPPTLWEGVTWEFETFDEYLDLIERRGVGINFGAFVGHNALRLWAMGDEAHDRVATADEVERMVAALGASIEAGALGLSVDRSRFHLGYRGRKTPSSVAGIQEVEALLAEVGRHGAVAQVNPDEEWAWLYEVQPRVGCRITWTSLTTSPPDTAFRTPWQQRLAGHRVGWAAGAEVFPQVTCRPISFQVTMLNPSPFVNVPAIRELMSAPGLEERLALCADSAWRARGAAEMASGRYVNPRWDNFTIDESAQRALCGRRVSELAAERGQDPFEVVVEVALADRLETRFRVVLSNDDEAGVTELLLTEGCVLGISDAGAHVSQLCDAPLPTDFLAHWVRDRSLVPLETGVRRLTGELADLVGLSDRGYVAPGRRADLVVLDLSDLDPGPLRRTADLPAGGDRLIADQVKGIRHVLVNGVPVCVDGAWPALEPGDGASSRLPGTVLRPATRRAAPVP